MNPYNFYDNPHFRDWGERQHRARSQGNKMQAVVVPLADDIQLHEFPILSIVRKGIVRIATLTNLDHLAKVSVLQYLLSRLQVFFTDFRFEITVLWAWVACF